MWSIISDGKNSILRGYEIKLKKMLSQHTMLWQHFLQSIFDNTANTQQHTSAASLKDIPAIILET